jgi:hypothetical protein
VEILWWLAPAAVVTTVVALVVGWLGRQRPEPDQEEVARRIGKALAKDHEQRYVVRQAARPRPSGLGRVTTPEADDGPGRRDGDT